MTNQVNAEYNSSFTHCKQVNADEISIYLKLKVDRVGEELIIQPQTQIEHRGRAEGVNEVYVICLKTIRHLHYFTCGEHVFHLTKLDMFEHKYERDMLDCVHTKYTITIEMIRCGDISVLFTVSTKKSAPKAKRPRRDDNYEFGEADAKDDEVIVDDVDGQYDGPSLCEVYNIELW